LAVGRGRCQDDTGIIIEQKPEHTAGGDIRLAEGVPAPHSGALIIPHRV